jgi:pyruvate-formate lyase-activating enzyme
MANILFTVWPFTGCVNPQVAVARWLAQRGHSVGFYTGRKFASLLEQQGFRFFPFQRPTTSVANAVPLEVYKRLFDQVAHFRPWFFLWGAEPMLYPDVLPLIGAIKERGMKVSLVTNGTTMKDKIPALVELGIDVILFSIDGARSDGPLRS